MKTKRVLAISCLLIVTAAGGTWQYVANKFEVAVRAQIQKLETFGIHLDGVEISEHLFRVSFQKLTFTPPERSMALLESAFPHLLASQPRQDASQMPAQLGADGNPVLIQKNPAPADLKEVLTAYLSLPFRIEMAYKTSITFNPLLKQTIIESDLNGQTFIKLGTFEQTFIQKGTDINPFSKIVLTHSEMSETNKGILEFIKSITSIQADSGAGSVSTKNNQFFEAKGAHTLAKWSISPEQKGSISVDYTCPGYKIDLTGFIETLRKNVALYPALDESLLILDKNLKKQIERKNINFHIAGDLDMKKAKELFSPEKTRADLDIALIPDGKFDVKFGTETDVSTYDIGFFAEKVLNRFALSTDAKFKLTENKSLILEGIFDELQLILKAGRSPLTLDKKSFITSFPDIISKDPISLSFKVDAHLYGLNNLTFQIKNPTTGLDVQAKTENDKVIADIVLTDAKKMIQISAQLAQWANAQFGVVKPEIKAMVDSMLPQYIQTASSALDKIGETKPGTLETRFRMEGNFKTFADIKINGKTPEECFMIILGAGLMGMAPQGAAH